MKDRHTFEIGLIGKVLGKFLLNWLEVGLHGGDEKGFELLDIIGGHTEELEGEKVGLHCKAEINDLILSIYKITFRLVQFRYDFILIRG